MKNFKKNMNKLFFCFLNNKINLCINFKGLEAPDTFGRCQRPVFSLWCILTHKICANLNSIGNRSCKRIMRRKKTPLSQIFVCFQMSNKRLQLKSVTIGVRTYLFVKNYVASEGAVSHNVLYYQQLSIAHYQVSFYAKIILSN